MRAAPSSRRSLPAWSFLSHGSQDFVFFGQVARKRRVSREECAQRRLCVFATLRRICVPALSYQLANTRSWTACPRCRWTPPSRSCPHVRCWVVHWAMLSCQQYDKLQFNVSVLHFVEGREVGGDTLAAE